MTLAYALCKLIRGRPKPDFSVSAATETHYSASHRSRNQTKSAFTVRFGAETNTKTEIRSISKTDICHAENLYV